METKLKTTLFGGYQRDEVDRLLAANARQFAEERAVLEKQWQDAELSRAQYRAECERLREENLALKVEKQKLLAEKKTLERTLHRLEFRMARAKDSLVGAVAHSVKNKLRDEMLDH